MKKRVFLLLLILVLVLSLSSCELLNSKLFGGGEKEVPADGSGGENENKPNDNIPEENKQEDPNGQETPSQDPSGEDPFEIVPSGEEPSGESTEGQDTSAEDPKPTQSSDTTPSHVHVYDQKVIAENYELPDGETYYYSCICGKSGYETFVHHHNFNQEVPSPEYKVVIEDADPEEQEAIKYQYYFSCKCGKRSTANGTFESKVEITGDTKYYGTLVDGTPVN